MTLISNVPIPKLTNIYDFPIYELCLGLSHTARLIVTAAGYLGTKLPYKILLPYQKRHGTSIMPSPTAQSLLVSEFADENNIALQRYPKDRVGTLAILTYNICWLAWTQQL
jgi:hypothetical protein